jgi:hypothetical protein
MDNKDVNNIRFWAAMLSFVLAVAYSIPQILWIISFPVAMINAMKLFRKA